ncbi:phage tail length tape measure family protein [Agrobacterium pusense]|uniref:Phage tail length tape measure family protein n=1 Tax=Agrobacterium pusense TaxID=648995 RepID=A0AA44EJE2_9HYPH|nr:phage tail length tape measure family protein [Agrobacterium pusense]NRF09400.1 phage tail length tape measure family protein [Agrobacterium pusense]NRF19695.1 phage tail length tape measure family protein [Agrobacterium pusense]
MANPLRISARVEIDAKPAQQGAATATKAVDAIGDAAQETAAQLAKLQQAASDGLRTPLVGNNPGADLDRMRAKYNPLYAAIMQYKQAQMEIRQAHAAGSLSADEMTAALERQRRAALANIDALKGRQRVVSTPDAANDNMGRFAAMNLTYQAQDIFATAGSMPWWTVAMQQGPQVAGVMQNVENKAATLRAALIGLVSPWSLISVAAVGAAAYAVQYLANTESGVKSVDDILAKHAENIQALGPAYRKALEEQQKYAQLSPAIVNAQLRDNSRSAVETALSEAQKSYGNMIASMQGSIFGSRGDESFTRLKGAKDAIDAFGASIDAGSPKVQEFHKEIVRLEEAGIISAKVSTELRGLADEALKAEQAVRTVSGASDPAISAFARLQEQINGINPFGAAGRLATLETSLEELYRSVRAGETNIQSLDRQIGQLSGANPDLSGAMKSIKDLFVQAMQAAGAVELLNGKLFNNAGAIGKSGRDPFEGLRSDRTASVNFFLRSDEGNELSEKLQGQADELRRKAEAAAKVGASDRNAYRDLIKTADDRIAQMKLEAQLAGQTGVAADALRFKLDLLQQAEEKGRSLSGKQIEAINSRVDAFRKYAEAASSAKLKADLLFEREQIGRSMMDQQIAGSLRSSGLPVDFNSYEAGLIRTNLQLQYARDLAGDFTSTFFAGLRQGQSFWDAFGNAGVKALERISDTLVNDVLNQMIGGGMGGGDLFGETFSFNLQEP